MQFNFMFSNDVFHSIFINSMAISYSNFVGNNSSYSHIYFFKDIPPSSLPMILEN